MKLRVDGKVYEHDPNRLLNSEARLVKRLVGMTIPEFQDGLGADDPDALAALVFIVKQRAGEDPDWDTLDFDHTTLAFVDDAAEVSEPAPKEAAPGG